VPLEGTSRVVAVLAVYRVQPDAFTAEDLSVLQAMGSKLGLAIEHAMQHSGGAASAAAHAGAD
jgi:GAF domain-containing protein